MFSDWPYKKKRVIRFTDRVEVHGSIDGESWVVVLTIPIYSSNDAKPREALFRLANVFDKVSGSLQQPNAESLRMLSQAYLDFAKTASNELVSAVIDHLVLHLNDYVTPDTRDSIARLNNEKESIK